MDAGRGPVLGKRAVTAGESSSSKRRRAVSEENVPAIRVHYLPKTETVLATPVPDSGKADPFVRAPVFALCDDDMVFQTILRYKPDSTMQVLLTPFSEDLDDEWEWQDLDVFVKHCRIRLDNLRVGVYEKDRVGAAISTLPQAHKPLIDLYMFPNEGMFPTIQALEEFGSKEEDGHKNAWVNECWMLMQQMISMWIPWGNEDTASRALKLFNQALMIIREYEVSKNVEGGRVLTFRFLQTLAANFHKSVEQQRQRKIQDSLDDINHKVSGLAQSQKQIMHMKDQMLRGAEQQDQLRAQFEVVSGEQHNPCASGGIPNGHNADDVNPGYAAAHSGMYAPPSRNSGEYVGQANPSPQFQNPSPQFQNPMHPMPPQPPMPPQYQSPSPQFQSQGTAEGHSLHPPVSAVEARPSVAASLQMPSRAYMPGNNIQQSPFVQATPNSAADEVSNEEGLRQFLSLFPGGLQPNGLIDPSLALESLPGLSGDFDLGGSLSDPGPPGDA